MDRGEWSVSRRVYAAAGRRRRAAFPAQQISDDQEIVGEDRGADEQLEVLATFDECSLHATSSEQHRDPAFDAGTEPLATFLNAAAFLKGFPFGTAGAA